jgi:hypothetical protein
VLSTVATAPDPLENITEARPALFANTQMLAMDFGFPDVCRTPPFAEPLPYPNIAMAETAIPTQFETLIMCMPAHNVTTIKPLTQGDDTGVMGGMVSQVDMGPCMHVDFVTNVMIGGPPATKLLNMTMQNLINIDGMTIVPSQVTVMMLQ